MLKPYTQFVGWLIEFCVQKMFGKFGLCVVLAIATSIYAVDYNFSATFFCLALSYIFYLIQGY